jgi:hypothetical protein
VFSLPILPFFGAITSPHLLSHQTRCSTLAPSTSKWITTSFVKRLFVVILSSSSSLPKTSWLILKPSLSPLQALRAFVTISCFCSSRHRLRGAESIFRDLAIICCLSHVLHTPHVQSFEISWSNSQRSQPAHHRLILANSRVAISVTEFVTVVIELVLVLH